MNPAVDVGEKLIRIVDEHWVKYLFPVFMFVVLLAASLLLLLLAGYAAHHAMWLSHIAFLAGLSLLLLTHHWFFARLLSEAGDCIIVTNKRVVHIQISLWFKDDMTEVSFDRLKTVQAEKEGFWQNLLRFGSLRFESLTIHGVPHPNRVARDIQQAMGRR